MVLEASARQLFAAVLWYVIDDTHMYTGRKGGTIMNETKQKENKDQTACAACVGFPLFDSFSPFYVVLFLDLSFFSHKNTHTHTHAHYRRMLRPAPASHLSFSSFSCFRRSLG
jgi:hypothetical protein